MTALGQADYRVNSVQDVIQGSNPNTPAAVNAQLDVWNTSSQAPFTMTYQFETAQPGDLWMSYSGWTAMSGAEQAAIRGVLDEYESVANVRFVLDNSLADPDINFGKVGLSAGVGGIGGWNFSFSYDGNNNITSRVMDHFAVFNNTLDLTAATNRSLLLHEIGHAMTLKHPGPYDVEGQVPPGPYLPAGEDSNKYTVMSYTADPDNGVKSDHLMLYDIAALQARWGVNTSYHTGNDIYTGPSGTIQSIWDAGGTDTIDGSGKQQAVTIDLHDGAFSSLGALNNFSIAFGALIENAVGSAFADTITGNDVANLLRGGGGNDTVDGAGGDDTFALTGLRSQYTVTILSATSARLVDTRAGSADGTDVISNIEHVQFADGTVDFGDLSNPVPVAGSVAINDVSITEGRLFRGAGGAAGEIGRMPFPWSASETPHREGLEHYLGSRALIERCRVDWPAGEGAPPDSAKDLFARALEGSPPAAAAVARHAADIGRLAAGCIGMLDPGLIVLGGGVGRNPLMTEKVEHVAADLAWPTRIAVSSLEDGGTALGAMKLAVDYSLGLMLREGRHPAVVLPPLTEITQDATDTAGQAKDV